MCKCLRRSAWLCIAVLSTRAVARYKHTKFLKLGAGKGKTYPGEPNSGHLHRPSVRCWITVTRYTGTRPVQQTQEAGLTFLPPLKTGISTLPFFVWISKKRKMQVSFAASLDLSSKGKKQIAFNDNMVVILMKLIFALIGCPTYIFKHSVLN